MHRQHLKARGIISQNAEDKMRADLARKRVQAVVVRPRIVTSRITNYSACLMAFLVCSVHNRTCTHSLLFP